MNDILVENKQKNENNSCNKNFNCLLTIAIWPVRLAILFLIWAASHELYYSCFHGEFPLPIPAEMGWKYSSKENFISRNLFDLIFSLSILVLSFMPRKLKFASLVIGVLYISSLFYKPNGNDFYNEWYDAPAKAILPITINIKGTVCQQ